VSTERVPRLRLLVRHFVRRFVDNDLLSAHVDRHESLGFFGATIVAAGLFAAILLAQKYVGYVSSVSWVAVMAMEDRFFMIAVSMIVAGLTTAAQWDALSVDSRDTAILGPLPIPRRLIVGAKAAANLVFLAGIVAAVAVGPSVIYTLFSLTAVPLTLAQGVRVLAAHLGATVLAATFAFSAIVAVRELLRVVTGARLFARVSTTVQAGCVMALTTMLLLTVGRPITVSTTWLAESAAPSVPALAVPPLWFLGLAEAIIGDVVALAPMRGVVVDDALSRLYTGWQPVFQQLGRQALLATVTTAAVAVLAYAWNSRRLPSPSTRAIRRRRPIGRLLRVLARSVVRHPVSQAGFFFTLRVILRSAPHRLAMAVAAAVALAVAIGIVGSAGLDHGGDASAVPLSLWALQPLVLLAVLAGFQHAMAVPADLRASWVFHQCWPGALGRYLSGVERAAIVVVVLPAMLALLPLHAYVLGVNVAILRVMNGTLLSVLLLWLALHGRNVPPFISSYVPRGNVKSVGPIYVMAAVTFSLVVAAVERAASASTRGALLHIVALASVAAVARAGWRRPADSAALAADLPEPTTQTLGLGA
jgi:hypothetical protein